MSVQNPSDPHIDVTSPYTPRRPSPIVSLSINHPIGTALRKIKNFLTHKQTLFATSFTIKITPIVAIVSLFGLAALFGGGVTTAYNFGKTVEQKFLSSSPTPTPKVIVVGSTIATVSTSGTIKATYQNPLPSPQGTTPSASEAASSATPTPQVTLHYILVSRSGSIHYLVAPGINLQNYLNLRVLLIGSFDSTKNTLTIFKSSDIEILQ